MAAVDIRVEDRIVDLLEKQHTVQDTATVAGATVALVEAVARKWRITPKGGFTMPATNGVRPAPAAAPVPGPQQAAAAPRPVPVPPAPPVPAAPLSRTANGEPVKWVPADQLLATALTRLRDTAATTPVPRLARAASKAAEALSTLMDIAEQAAAEAAELEEKRRAREEAAAELEKARRALAAAQRRAKDLGVRAPSTPRPPRPEGAKGPGRELQPCGTQAAYQRHKRAKEKPCQPCCDAWADVQRDYAARKKAAAS